MLKSKKYNTNPIPNFLAETIMYQLAEISISYKPAQKLSELQIINSSTDCEKLFRNFWSDDLNYCEEFIIMLINRANRVLGFSKISKGGIAGTVADPKIIFQNALKSNASSLILCHNHPSGNLKPSQADLDLTRKIKQAGQFLDITVLDHIILTEEGFYSFADEGLM